MATVLFGTVEYYEKELLDHLARGKNSGTGTDTLSKIVSVLKDEIMNAALLDEAMRAQCLQNLMLAFGRLPHQAFDQHPLPDA